ncbi:hypothetical protein [Aggregatibacter kilianii]|uniref:hypothetical protein n=1 Tax=Aggregatibacter kilianii TaxID=2025884 RepID=UPI000D6418D0|nr:hypothetical protein [Aggregatibacter kilianii]
MKKKTLLLLGTVLSLTACSMSELGLSDDSPNWRPYKDIDQSTQYISFVSTTTAYAQSHPNETRTDSVGRAYRKGAQGVEDLIGNLYYIYDAHVNSMAIYFGTENANSLSPHQKEDVNKLAKAKKIDFYEFGKGRLAHAEFTAKKSMCTDFNGKNGVKVKMATNYYQDYDNYYTILLSATISKQDIKDMNYKPLVTGSSAFVAESKKHEAKQGQQLALANLKEKATIFTNIICR